MAGKMTVPGALSLKDVAADLSALGETIIARIGGVLKASVDGAAFAALGAGGFGSDTVVQLPNANSALVNALELIATLTSNVAGAEVSQWAISLLNGGAQVASYIFGALGLTVPAGSTAVPSVNFAGDTTSGMYRQNVGDLRLIDRGTGVLSWGQGGILNLINATGFYWANLVGIYQQGPNNANGGVRGAATGNAEIGAAGALATNATAGFINMPTCAGAPTGAVANVSAGKAPMVFDTTNNKIWFNVGGTTWKGVVVA